MEEIVKPAKRSTADVLGGIGQGILEDLSMSIHQTQARQDGDQIGDEKRSNFDISEDKKIGDSTFDAFNGSKF